MEEYIVYVRTDAAGRITGIDSSAFLKETAGWTEIDRGSAWPKYRLAQGNYFPKPIYTEEGLLRYKLVDGQPVERTQAELDAETEEYMASLPSEPIIVQIDAPTAEAADMALALGLLGVEPEEGGSDGEMA